MPGGRYWLLELAVNIGCDFGWFVLHRPSPSAGIAQLVEHHVANVDVASSSLVSRSTFHSKEKKCTKKYKA